MAARPYRAWRGAIEFAGFPVNVSLYSRVRRAKGLSFRQLSPAGNPVSQQLVDSVTGELVERSELLKGHAVSKDEYVVMSPEALDMIDSGVKTEVAKPSQFVPVDSVPWGLATDQYEAQPDKDTPGSGQAVNIVWNGLKANKLAYVTQVSLRGGMDGILAIRADQHGMWAAMLPFADELYTNPPTEFEKNPEAAALFAQVVESHYTEERLPAFDHTGFESEYKARRQEAIDLVLAGEPIEVQAPAPTTDAPDLMALMQASVGKPTESDRRAALKARKDGEVAEVVRP